MKLIVPHYYQAFRCIAGDCRHSCCIGWEIDIDGDSLARYADVPGQMGQRLHQHIDWETGCFRLGEGERCPFLNQDGLCDIIIHQGEDALCQICADHPRFRNFLSDRVEMGLGLCCEAAAELILMHQDRVTFLTLEDDGGQEKPDEAFLALRKRLLDVAQDRSMPIRQRVQRIMDIDCDMDEWAEVLLSLERLDESWAGYILRLRQQEQPIPAKYETPLEQLLVYLIYRHLAGAAEDGRVAARVAYCCMIWQLLARMLRDDLPALCRMYSSEIEYSDENMLAILDHIDENMFDS